MPKTIDQLPGATSLTGTETLPVNQAGVTKHANIYMIQAFIATLFEAAGAVASGMAAHLAAYVHADITHTNRTALDLVSGTNTGDQDLTAITPVTGTFTPIDVSGATLTFTNASGRYSKIGTTVIANLNLIYPTTTDASLAKIGGLPFLADGEQWVTIPASGYSINVAKIFTGTNVITFINNNNVYSAQTINTVIVYKAV